MSIGKIRAYSPLLTDYRNGPRCSVAEIEEDVSGSMAQSRRMLAAAEKAERVGGGVVTLAGKPILHAADQAGAYARRAG